MVRYFYRTLLAHFRQGRALYLLTVLGVALGVASVLSIQIINRSAVGAFRGSIEAISGAADLSVLSRAGAFQEAIIAEVLATPGVFAAWPIYRLDLRVEAEPPFYLDLYGMDLAAPAPHFAYRVSNFQLERAPSEFLTRPGLIAVAKDLAVERGWEKGSKLRASNGARKATLVIGALLDLDRYSPQAGNKLAVMDIAQAQSLLGRPGRIHQIDVVARRDSPDEGLSRQRVEQLARRLEARLGDGFKVLSGDERAEEARGLLSAFRLNLTALSLISLLVGLFLIYAATQAALVRRRSEFGLLRSLGATRAQILALILAEAALLGGLGTALGLPAGYYVALANIDVVSTTLTNIYLLSEIESLAFPLWFYALAAAIGIGGVLLGALFPALDASRRDPREMLASVTLSERAAAFARPAALAGALQLAAVTGWWLWAGHGYKPGGFILALAILLFVPLCAPLAVQSAFRGIKLRGFGFDYALRTLSLQLQKTSTAVAALSIAVCMLIGITLMIGSFRETVEVWMNATVRADIYVATKSWRSGNFEAALRPELVESLRSLPQVAYIDKLRSRRVHVDEALQIPVAGVDMSLPAGRDRFPLRQGDPEEAYAKARAGGVLVSEPLARRKNLSPGDTLTVYTADGTKELPIAGVYYDYASERGAAAVDWDTFADLFGPGPPSNIALYLEGDSGSADRTSKLVDRLRTRYADEPLTFTSNENLRRSALEIFDQTFAVVRILQAMSLLIAVAGITLTLLILAREGVSELALYRALGARRRQIFRVYLGKALGMSLLSLALGAAGGLALAAVLVHVINRDYFGWTIQFHFPWPALFNEAASILLASLAAAIYPALRAARTPATELAKDEL